MASNDPAADPQSSSSAANASAAADGTSVGASSVDSAYGDDGNEEESTVSVTSTVYKYRKEHGRTYHAYKDGQYAFPNDATEMDRLDLQHCIFLMSLGGKLNLAPIHANPLNVLDVGTGTGLWAMDFADAYPSAQVLGVDLSPIQETCVPPNLLFQVDDANERWTYSQKFDFIFLRQSHAAINEKRFLHQAMDFLVPGGWVEMQELALPVRSDDGSLKPESALSRCHSLITEACVKIGQDPTNPPRYEGWMKEAGFENVQVHVVNWSCNTWPEDKRAKTLGRWTLENYLQGVQGFTMALFTRVLGWSAEEVEMFLVDVRKDVKNTSIHAYWPLYIVYGQKPKV